MIGTKYLRLKAKRNFGKADKIDFRELNIDQLSVGRAWNRKELLIHLWEYLYEKPAREFFKRWYFPVAHSRLKPIIDVSKDAQTTY